MHLNISVLHVLTFMVRKRVSAMNHEKKANFAGSLVPFNLRLLFAELPVYMGKDPNCDALYSLLSYCKQHMDGKGMCQKKKIQSLTP